MSSKDTVTGPKVDGGHDAYWLRPDQGDARWVLGELDRIMATADRTGGLFGLKESLDRRGGGPPLHVHEREDEACYVLEGEITFFVGADVIRASAGTWIYLPRGVPHSLRIESDEAKTLWLVVPGGFESFFVDVFPPVTEGSSPTDGQPDVERMAEAAARYGVTILGPAPGETTEGSGRDG
jgi:mannose-6-phosphate isomerase-like protein (cupin superfamily)